MNATAEMDARAEAGNRWWIYQRERFPIFAHGPLILAFSFSAVSFSWLLRTNAGWPGWRSALVAFATCFLFFLQLRLADEFKDFEEDSRFRPYRPVPRGLVTLRELAVLFVIAAVVQLVLALWLAPRMVLLLFVPWLYLAGMSKEFFAREWLKARPITYLWTHMLIMPLVDFYATGCDWLASGAAMPRGLFWFLAASFCNGVVIELGRKIRAPVDEEPGVQTYSTLWGRERAVAAWLGMLVLTAGCATLAAAKIHFTIPVVATLGTLLLIATLIAWNFITRSAERGTRNPEPLRTSRSALRVPPAGAGKRIELLSGLWTLALYLSLGIAPLLWRNFFAR
jgi:4-hydroxybenzoate polyprenyltransferase